LGRCLAIRRLYCLAPSWAAHYRSKYWDAIGSARGVIGLLLEPWPSLARHCPWKQLLVVDDERRSGGDVRLGGH